MVSPYPARQVGNASATLLLGARGALASVVTLPGQLLQVDVDYFNIG